MEGYVALSNELFGKKGKVTDIVSWDSTTNLGITPSQSDQVWEQLDWMGLRTIPGAVGSIRQLLVDHTFVFITARHDIPTTREWLSRFVPNVHVVYGHGGTKAGIAMDLGAEVLIEDRLLEIEACSVVGFPTILFDRPWNRSYNHPYRATGWPQVVEHIDTMSKSNSSPSTPHEDSTYAR